MKGEQRLTVSALWAALRATAADQSTTDDRLDSAQLSGVTVYVRVGAVAAVDMQTAFDAADADVAAAAAGACIDDNGDDDGALTL